MGKVVYRVPVGDLDSVEAVAEMVRRFYGEVAQDDVLGPMFEEVAQVDWSAHIPKLTAFWSRMLLGLEGYNGNTLETHRLIHDKRSFSEEHFHRWLEIFHDTIDEGWTGPVAERAKMLGRNVARVHSAQLLGRAVSVDGYDSLGRPATVGTTSTAPA